jgi:predicted TPR repeat methyltransferase
VRFLSGAIHGGPQAGREAYERQAGADATPLATIAPTAVSLLSAYGYGETALAVARAFLTGDGDDPVHRYQLAALAAEPLERAPADYVATYFDRFADTFDDQLYGVLQYAGPRRLHELVSATGAATARTVDLGCGTGAAGALLRARATRLEGVDLSAKMLEKAEARGLYDELTQADMVAFLAARPQAFDLVFAADAVLYLGDLSGLIEAAAGAIVAGGSLALTLEPTTRGVYELTASGRFAHSPRGLIAAAAPWFSLRAMRRAFLRLEAHRRVYGALVVLERRG